MKHKNKPKREHRKAKRKADTRAQDKYKDTRGKRFNPWVYKYFDVTADLKEDKE